ncbi:6,7-dimethyl-8-ribityllumazine synthase [Salinisphaera sp. P385]|uniref:6,7-dimethyl-8-ribityllumazine synthase n=1 Tax=Spectribacter acetivorans TaxID=3075603 RepID=A0ABU3BCQ0_9GAMM|nr:6,7-dimethyl-8-ribityllumazine synthase [Salinisphaera sp. P385]MDT0618766.1 6,7-dimethyl-8-ribityllumazine synthase [Salinisphaera sp. P385]
MQTIEAEFDASGARFAVVATRWNDAIVDLLVDGALEVLRDAGVDDADITLIRVPGAFELPLVCDRLADSGDYDAVIALGAVIRGETPHFDFVAGECARGLAAVAVENSIPVTFGVITADTMEQAEDRSRPGEDNNKGIEAASAAVEMVGILRQIDE